MIVFALVLTVLLDTTMRRHLPATEFQLMLLPSLSLATALYIGIHARTSGQLGYAVLLGLIVDCFSARPVGYFGFLFGATAYLAWRVRKYVPPDAVIPRVVACLLCGFVFSFLGLVLAAITGGNAGNAPGFLRALAMVSTTALSAPLLFAIWNQSRIFRRVFRGRRHYEWAS